MRIWKPKVVTTTDGYGREYQCQEGQLVMDCARCARLVTRRVDQNQRGGRQVLGLGGHLFDVHGHPRPYCNQCYLIECGVILQ